MGTRNLVMVVYQGKFRVAQYGQWDGYPSGQGYTVLDFCRKYLKDPAKRDHFVKQVAKTKFLSEAQIKDTYKLAGVTGEWITFEQADAVKKIHPQLSRDTGAEVLKIINNSKEKQIGLRDSIEFARDSLFCEWAYLIDLDTNVLEAYSGFNTKPIPEHERFGKLNPLRKPKGQSTEYYPINLLTAWSLNSLPTKREFKSTLTKLEHQKTMSNDDNGEVAA